MQEQPIAIEPTTSATVRPRTTSRAPSEDAEARRLEEDSRRARNWKRWGPYLSERQWGTVREDYSEWGNCWEYFSHDQAPRRESRTCFASPSRYAAS